MMKISTLSFGKITRKGKVLTDTNLASFYHNYLQICYPNNTAIKSSIFFKKIKQTMLTSRTALLVLLMGIFIITTAVTINGQVDGSYIPQTGEMDDEYYNSFTKYYGPASGTCEIEQVWAKIITDGFGEPTAVQLGFYNGNAGTALFRIYIDTDNNPNTGLTLDTDLNPDFAVLGAELVFQINVLNGVYAVYDHLLNPVVGSGITGAAGDYIAPDADGKFFEIYIPFDDIAFDICDPSGVINVAQYIAVSGGSIGSSQCGDDVLSFQIGVGGQVGPHQTICPGETPNLMTLAGYEGTIEKWQYSTDYDPANPDLATWTDTNPSNNLPTYTPPDPIYETTYYSALVAVPGCPETFLPSLPATITVEDNEAPEITCPADIIQNVDEGDCGAVVTYEATATDNCSALVTYDSDPGTVFPVGTTTVTATATDPAGNTVQCSFTVTVVDNEAPVITCPADITQNVDEGECEAVVTYAAAATDNCSAVVTYDIASGTVFSVGTTTVTATATDPAGNTAQCSFTVTVEDIEAPEITCAVTEDQTVDANSGDPLTQYLKSGTDWDATASDNCSVDLTWALTGATNNSNTAESSTLDGVTFIEGTTTVTWTATDNAGNTADCSFDVIVNAKADLSILKSVLTTEVVTGGELKYLITVTNNGPSVARNVTITDDVTGFLSTPEYSLDDATYATWTGTYDVTENIADGSIVLLY